MAAAYLILLSVVFIGMATSVLRMYQGVPNYQPAAIPGGWPDEESGTRSRGPLVESLLSVIPPTALGAAVLLLGIYIPPNLQDVLERAARAIAG